MGAVGGFPETRASLVARLRDADDGEAWTDFVGLYRPVIYRLARHRGLQDADAQDLSQRVLAAVSKSVWKWQPDENRAKFRTWLARIANNAISNAATRRRPDYPRGGSSVWELLADCPDEGFDSSTAGFEFEARRETFRQAAIRVRREVSPEQWEMFELSTVGGLTVEATAARLGKSLGTTYAARSRVMRKLKEAVKEMNVA